jgi:DMSO/TMAO reductase YedYZ molybdopterin-dependent catalytic subunit
MNYIVSVPWSKVKTNKVLLAWEMNGEPLPKIHGYPLRAVVFGYIGARSVKWLYRIKAIPHPSRAPVQSRKYLCLTAKLANTTRNILAESRFKRCPSHPRSWSPGRKKLSFTRAISVSKAGPTAAAGVGLNEWRFRRTAASSGMLWRPRTCRTSTSTRGAPSISTCHSMRRGVWSCVVAAGTIVLTRSRCMCRVRGIGDCM